MVLDRHTTRGSGATLRVAKDVQIQNFSPYALAYLKNIRTAPDGTVKRICCETPIPVQIKSRCEHAFSAAVPAAEDAYIIETAGDAITVYAENARAALYAAARIFATDGMQEGLVCNYPTGELRLVKLYLPSPENIAYFKELIDLCLYYGFNAVMLELGGAMEYKTHPEIADGWREYAKLTSDHINGRGTNPHFPYANAETYFFKNSIHCENGGGEVLTQAQVRELVDYCTARGMEVIPEVPSLSHSDYLLTRHPELAERKEDIYPDAYCPSNPATYELLFDILEEIIEVFRPKRINICHDELYSVGLCERCRGKSAAQLYTEDVMKLYTFLKAHGVDTMLWSDKLINSHDKQGTPWGGARKEVIHPKTKALLEVVEPTYTAIEEIPRDIQILHWFWSIEECVEDDFLKRGFWTMFGNFEPLRIKNSVRRLQKGVRGIGVSNWSKTDALHIQRNGICLSIALAAKILWSGQFNEALPEEDVLAAAADLYRYRTKSAPHKAEILHTYHKDVPYELYFDGYEINREKHILGDYIVNYADGTQTREPIEYGKTVGFSGVDRARRESDWCDSYAPDNRFMEPAYSCEYVCEGQKTYYRYAIVSDKAIKSVTVIPKTELAQYLEIKEIKLH